MPLRELTDDRVLDSLLERSRNAAGGCGWSAQDGLDAMWLARLTELVLLRVGFVPPKAIRDLRDYTRMRTRLI